METRSKINAELDFLTASQGQSQNEVRRDVADKCAQECTTARPLSDEEIIKDLFTYHAPQNKETVMKYEVVRDAAKHLALQIWKACPYGADRTAAIRKLREAVMTANAAIALEGRSI
jgi:hypothetical protein